MKDKSELNDLLGDYFASRCPRCLGSKWLVEGGVARRCDCFEQELAGHRRTFAGIPPTYAHCSLTNFYPRKNYHGQHEALVKAKHFVTNFELDFIGRGILFRGGVGVGKTHLAVAILKGLVEKGFTGMFFNFVHLIEKIKQSYDPATDLAEPGLMRDLARCQVVVMDELGATKPTEFVFNKLYDIINSCFDQNISVIFTTNYSDRISLSRKPLPPAINFDKAEEVTRPNVAQPPPAVAAGYTLAERINERLHSRILERSLDIFIDGEDYRLIKKAGGQ